MKKTEFYRIYSDGKKRFFKSDYGYIHTVTTPDGRKIKLAIAKNDFNEWDITHVESGQLATVIPFRTKKDAIYQIKQNDYLSILARVTKNDRTEQCKKLLNIHKFKMQAQ